MTPSFILSEAAGARGTPSLGSFYSLYYTIEYPVLTFNVALCNTYFTERSTPMHQNIRFIFLALGSPRTEPRIEGILSFEAGFVSLERLTHKTGIERISRTGHDLRRGVYGIPKFRGPSLR